MEGKDGKTEPATEKRRSERREKGDLCISSEIVTVTSLFFGCLGLYWAVPHMGDKLASLWLEITQIPVGANEVWDIATLQNWYRGGTAFLGMMTAPIFIPVVFASVIANMAQTGPYLSSQALTLRFNSLNPINGFKQLFSMQSIYNMGLSILKIILVSGVIWVLVKKQIPTIMSLSQCSLDALGPWLIHLMFVIAMTVITLAIIIAVIDYYYRHHTYEKSMMMTKKEVEDERKSQELPATVKTAQRRKMRDLSLSRMMAAVPSANLIITNPTHVAIALQYDPEKMVAPRVVAKGLRLVAQRIKDIAAENNVPIVEKPVVARDLYKNVKVGQQIPARLFGAIAEILAFLYRLGNEKIRQTVGTNRTVVTPPTNRKTEIL